MPPRYGISQRPGRLDEAIVSLAARGIVRADYVPTKGVTIVKLQRDVAVYFPGGLAVRQSGKVAVPEAGPSSILLL
jgi:hypothetical protein